jgi:hypothetical protein
MTNMKNVLSALALVAALASSAVAQSSEGSGPGGLGGGLGGSIGLGVPGGVGGGLGGASGFLNATGSVSVSNPAGGTVTISQAIAQALGAVLNNSSTAEQRAALAAAIGNGGPALVEALVALGSNPSSATLVAAVNAFNAAVDALPAGATPTPALLAARQVLAAM